MSFYKLSDPLNQQGVTYGKYVDFPIYKNFEIIELEMSKLIDETILEEEIPGKPEEPSILNIDPDAPIEEHDVIQEGGAQDITPGAVDKTDKTGFFGSGLE